ncbi:DUF4139 domain-containing protein [Maridesulfovibrio zosterae]|uniref:DUF4139 domain-containing protein n=1 Tax=Maridesulfovibrio zosterae TaxID=82171 RepID=UPI000482F90A|nr:DUF4139 domain-containing protein [Maridesulfovibrio zosterae]
MLKKILFLVLLSVLWCGSGAAAGRVVFYPSGADFSQNLRSSIQTGENGEYVMFTLSGQASPETFSVSPLSKGVSVNDVSWTRSDLSQSPAVVEIAKKIDQLKFKLNSVRSEKQALEGGILFWTERGKVQEAKAVELDKIAGLVVSNLSSLYLKSAKIDVKITEIQDLIKDLQRKQREMSGPNKMVWNVKVSVSAKGAKSAEFKLSYMLNNCGWTPHYKLDAYPEQGEVKFSFDAEIRQGSGVDFKDCNIALATVRKFSRISPPILNKWRIEPKVEDEAPRVAMDMANYALEASVVPRKLKVQSVPRQVSMATYSLWEMGRKTIPAGSTKKYTVVTENWKSDFTFLARPSLSPDVFVLADVKLDNAKDYPLGSSILFMEGAMIGKNNFIFSGNKKEMYFGSDPMLKVQRKTLEKLSGDRGLFGSTQTYNWKYLIEIENARKSEVKVKVQEAAPDAGDKSIKLVVKSSPKAKMEDNNFEWVVSVPATAKSSIEYSIELKAPDDMKLDLGIGR